MGFIGECGSVRELCDFGDSTPAGPALRARVALEFAVTTVLALFLGLGMSCDDWASAFSLLSPSEISSL